MSLARPNWFSMMIDTAVGEPPDLGGVPDNWRARLEEFVRQLAEVWRQHPWIPAVTVGSRVMGPREAGWIESAVAALAETGLTGDERLAAVFLLFGHVPQHAVDGHRRNPALVRGQRAGPSRSAAMPSFSPSSARR